MSRSSKQPPDVRYHVPNLERALEILQPIEFVIDIGTRFAIHAAAPAKAVLSVMPAAERNLIAIDERWAQASARRVAS